MSSNIAINKDTPNAQVCAVCIEPLSDGTKLKTIGCMHAFHERCIDKWEREGKGNGSCPTCRYEFSVVPLATGGLSAETIARLSDEEYPLLRRHEDTDVTNHPGARMCWCLTAIVIIGMGVLIFISQD